MENVMFESSVKLVWSPMPLKYFRVHNKFESSVKLVWSPMICSLP